MLNGAYVIIIIIERALEEKVHDADESMDSNGVCSDPIGQLYSLACHFRSGNCDRQNYSAFRQQLWTCMQAFPHICESRSRIIVPIFLKFIE